MPFKKRYFFKRHTIITRNGKDYKNCKSKV